MADFYTNVQVQKGKILYRGIENGKRVKGRVGFKPTLFVSSNEETKYKTIEGLSVSPIHFNSIHDCRQFVQQYSDVQGFKWYGNTRHEYAFIAENFSEDHVDWDASKILIANLDIETKYEDGFPEPALANQEITAITLKLGKTFHIFGCKPFIHEYPDVIYYRCKDEYDLCKQFLAVWSEDYPDIVTGWNIEFFDIPYLHNRITKLLGIDIADTLSPWNTVQAREVDRGYNRTAEAKRLIGIAILDYIDMYQRFAPAGKSQPSYKLDSIAEVELGQKKIDHSEDGGLAKLYINNYQKYIEYNLQDVKLVDKLDEKLDLINLVLTLAYQSKSNYEDAFAQVTMWDAIIYNYLKARNIVLPPKKDHDKSGKYDGAYVKDPVVGKHEWIVSVDFDSLYPHLIVLSNLGPDAIVEPEDYSDAVRKLLSQTITVDTLLSKLIDTSCLKDENLALAANGQVFRRNSQSFMSEIVENMYGDRKKFKGLMTDAKKALQDKTLSESKIKELQYAVSKYNNLQLAMKVCLNSLYGMMGNEYARLYDIRQATAITLTGQLAIRWVEKDINAYLNKACGTQDIPFVVYLDTDSCYISLKPLIDMVYKGKETEVDKIITFMDKFCNESLQRVIDKSCQGLADYLNSYKQALHMKRESLADVGIWTSKKRYIINSYDDEGIRYQKPKLKIMGLEIQKSSTPNFFKPHMKRAIEIMVSGTQEELIRYVDEVYDKMKAEKGYETISFPRGVNGLQKYSDAKTIYASGCPMHVRAALIFNHYVIANRLEKEFELIRDGNKMRFIYIKTPNILKSNVIGFIDRLPDQLNIMKLIDYKTQFDKAYVDPMKIVSDAIGWQIEEQNTMLAFLK